MGVLLLGPCHDRLYPWYSCPAVIHRGGGGALAPGHARYSELGRQPLCMGGSKGLPSGTVCPIADAPGGETPVWIDLSGEGHT